MAVVAYLLASQITPVTGYNYVADLQYGSDGQIPEPPGEVDAGTATNKVTGRATWDNNLNDGVDSGWLDASYSLKAGTKGLTWVTGGADGPLNYNVGTLNSISSMRIRAAVQNQAAMLWQNVQLNFYRGGTLQETVYLNSFGVDQTASGGVQQELVTIQPARTDNNQVMITGQFRMISPAGVYLDAYDAFSQILSFSPGRAGAAANSAESSELVQPITAMDAAGIPASSPFSDDLLGVQQSPDILQSDGASLL